MLYQQTPLIYSEALSQIGKTNVYLKLEMLQPSGSFKNRGIGHLCEHYTKLGAKRFISSSGGNAGLAVAYSGKQLGISVTAVVPETSSVLMIEKIQKEGAEVIVHGKDWNAADKVARELADAKQVFYVPPFDHPLIWQGHAGLVHEIKESEIVPDAVVLAVGGGGLFCGVAQGLQEVEWENVPIITAETIGAASFAKSVQERRLVTLPCIETVATSLGAKTVAPQAFEWSQKRPVIPCVVSDRQALQACLQFLEHHRLLVEPACGAALSVIYEKVIELNLYQNVVVVVCGGNLVSLHLLDQWKEKIKE